MGNLADAGVPVKFGDNIFSIVCVLNRKSSRKT